MKETSYNKKERLTTAMLSVANILFFIDDHLSQMC